MNKTKITLISLILIINYLFLGFIMAHNLYLNGEKQDLIYYNLEPQSTVRNNKTSSDTPDYIVGAAAHEMLLNPISYNDFRVYLDAAQARGQTQTYSALKFKSDLMGYNNIGNIKNGYFFPFTKNDINPNIKGNITKYSDTLISGYVIVYINTNDKLLYKEFNNELLPFTVTFTYEDAISNLNNKTKIELSDEEKTLLYTPTVTIEQSEDANTGYALSMSATTSQTNIIQDNNCGVQLNSVKQIKLSDWEDFPADTGDLLTEIETGVGTWKYNYVRLYHLKSSSQVVPDPDAASDPLFKLPINKLSSGNTVDSAYIVGFIRISNISDADASKSIKHKCLYIAPVDIRNTEPSDYIYDKYNQFGWGVKYYSLNAASEPLDYASFYIHIDAKRNSTYVVDAYIYQYGQSTNHDAHPA